MTAALLRLAETADLVFFFCYCRNKRKDSKSGAVKPEVSKNCYYLYAFCR